MGNNKDNPDYLPIIANEPLSRKLELFKNEFHHQMSFLFNLKPNQDYKIEHVTNASEEVLFKVQLLTPSAQTMQQKFKDIITVLAEQKYITIARIIINS